MKATFVIFVLAAQLACNSASTTGKGPGGRGGLPPSPVTAAKAELRDVPVQVREIGSVDPIALIAVKAQIGGELTRVLFKEGDNVRKGQQLFQIDPRPYQQAIDQAQAAVAKDNALIAQAEANLARDRVQTANAKEQADRYEALAKEGLISKDQNSTYQTTFNSQNEALRADDAAINSAKASLNVDKAALETAKLNLSYCSISSPIDGRAGGLLVQAGNLVKANDTTALVNINQMEPIYVTFSVPEQILNEIRDYSRERPLAVTAIVSPQGSAAAVRKEGRLTFIDNLVDNTTGTIKLRAEFPNTDRALWPGQFVNVVMTLRTLQNVTVIPSEAIQSGQQGQFVFILKPDQTVETRIVKPGQIVEKQIVIDSGLAAGETVITDGQMRLIPGARVRVVPPVNANPAGAATEPPDEHFAVLHRTPHLHHPDRPRHIAVRHRRLSRAARRRAAQRGLPHHPGQRQPARRQPGDHGLIRRHAAGTPVLHHRRHRLDELRRTRWAAPSITLQFTLDRNIDAAAQDVQSAIAAAGGLLPPNMPRPPSFKKVNPADQPIFYLALSSDTLPLYTVDEYAETVMAQRISMVSGVSQVQVYGAQKYAVRMQLDPDALAARGIGIDEVQARHRSQQRQSAHRQALRRTSRRSPCSPRGQLTNAAAVSPA